MVRRPIIQGNAKACSILGGVLNLQLASKFALLAVFLGLPRRAETPKELRREAWGGKSC